MVAEVVQLKVSERNSGCGGGAREGSEAELEAQDAPCLRPEQDLDITLLPLAQGVLTLHPRADRPWMMRPLGDHRRDVVLAWLAPRTPLCTTLGTAPRQQPHLGRLHSKLSSLASSGTRVQREGTRWALPLETGTKEGGMQWRKAGGKRGAARFELG